MSYKYLVVTKGLSNVVEVNNSNQLRKAITKLEKLGHKKPQVYCRRSK